jgi:small conductance mechanosensitive channel
MPTEMTRLQKLGETMSLHGTQMALALVELIVGLLIARWINKMLNRKLRQWFPKWRHVSVFCNVIYLLMVAIVIVAAAVEFGAQPDNMLRLLTIVTLVAVGLMLFFRPFLPSMPFKVGNTIKAGDLLGVVEAITFLNTRVRTFDGKTFFVPNRKILDDVVINYHFTETRRVKVDVRIRYDQDLLKAKRLLETIMTADPRVKEKPGPMVYVMNLTNDCVELGGRCWVDNRNYWVTRCDLLEKTKLRFENEGIQFAYPKMDVNLSSGSAAIAHQMHPPSEMGS